MRSTSEPLRAAWLLLLGATAIVGACKGGTDQEGLQATLEAPGECGLGQLVRIDAAGSNAGGGAIVEYAFFFGDGSPALRTHEAQADHVYSNAGSFQVAVRITDDEGQTSRDSARIVLTGDLPSGGQCLPDGGVGGGEGEGEGVPDCLAGETRACGDDTGACAAGVQTCGAGGEFGSCEGAVGPIDEECGNTLDDDCDGQVDEGCAPCSDGEERDCGSRIGECAWGKQICADGIFGPCAGGRGPRDEVCDGLDNDCDGDTDQGLSCDCDHGEVRRCGSAQGECRAGQQTCADGTWGGCVGSVGPVAELCDGLDNDCNGMVDEGCQCEPGQSRQCGTDQGACRSGIQVCEDGGWGTCLGARPPSDEICDGVDNDCDGQLDEGCECEENATRTCGSDVGECVSGSQVCRGGEWGRCVGASPPGPEDCDGLDNDCNGVVDDLCPCQVGETRPCGPDQGDCNPGRQRCVDGNWGQCTGVTLPENETCDSRDNDCDGEIDEAMVRRCSTRCGNGVEACQDGVFGQCTAPPVEVEVCDGRDNDCDGAFDEGITRDCSNACGRGEEVCVGGRFQGCDSPTPAPEECNGVDDDCNGAVDDGLALPSCPLQLGVCRGSTHPCRGDGFGLCTPATYGPGYEAAERTCDGLDNDCDGGIDEGCACEPGIRRACGTGIGACRAGIQTCEGGGVWGDCEGSVDPAPEDCDGLDNDCDGTADEDLRLACSTACGDGFEICADGRFQICDAPQPGVEECDGVDNDCDGQIDEDCFCVPGEARACGSNVGQCRAGFQVCLGNQWSPCQGESGPTPEGCDGLDNDCDGDVDETCRCQPGQRQACGLDVGECRAGEQTCDNVGAWGACNGGIGPVDEECDGLDNDCDGLLDELCPCRPGDRRICGSNVGACQSGVQICLLGRWGPCFGEQGPGPEQCDGIDNDCDAVIDEICECRGGEVRQCGVDTGECRRGRQFCLDTGEFERCQGGIDPQPEICDGLDNDCDGQADESCVCRDGDTRNCGSDVGTCAPGVQVCIGGVFGQCEGEVGPVAEECDGQDNDCDELVDEDIACECINGDVQRCGSNDGTCSSGVQRCNGGRWGFCQGEVGPAPEECDGLDNDCDGVNDNGLNCQCLNGETRDCGSDVGECIAGDETCLAGAWGACVGDVGPVAEACDGLDNDCDGQPDEGCDCLPADRRPCGEDVGACELGEQTCGDDGQWGQCQGGVNPSDEACGDGLDNDCDGGVDEGCECNPGERQDCGPDPVGACRQGEQLCQRNGQWADCRGDVGPSPEICGDNVDNDCNGQTDETCECQDGDSRGCGTDIGTCQAGIQSCVGGFWTNQCVGEVGPSPEACDGLDNDCDGAIDPDCECIDGSTQACGSDIGQCQAGLQRCTGGRFEDCEGEVGPTNELCDGLDNDCDGAVDESPDDGAACECQIGQERPCGTDVGSCSVGSQTCGDEGRWGGCLGEVGPSPESCDPAGSDEDCDGQTDEDCGECNPGATRGCGSDIGACQRGVETCGDDRFFGACEGAVTPIAEACNAVDDNCDGVVDEDCDCIHGQPSACGSDVGRCLTGLADCQFGVLGPCEGGRGPEEEVCNDLDDDCDGVVDDDGGGAVCACVQGSSRTCGTAVGECESGNQVCVFGAWGQCLGGTEPSPEACDGLDNDCDGTIDNGCGCRDGMTRQCGTDIGECVAGTQTCAGGGWGACVGAVDPQPEVCGDGLDNDCDGNPDTGCQCQPFTLRDCGSDVGTCEPGVQVCSRFGSWSNCANGVPPAFEICDGLDNDCDGAVDNGCDCNAGEFRVCGSDVGECQAGRERCINGSYGECEGGTGPEPDACDDVDNDCDGLTDEGCPCQIGETRECGTSIGICQKGLQVCGAFGGFGPCIGGVQPDDEVCDGLDNDCDGQADEDDDGGLVVCDSDDGDCDDLDGFVRVDDSTCVFRRHDPGVRICDDRGLCPPPICQQFQDELTAECGECFALNGCDADEEGTCEPLPQGSPCGNGGGCDGDGVCDDIGCADGSREGFVDRGRFPNIASCIADWVGTANMRAQPSGQPCGDDLGQCARPADACMAGWHVCMDNGQSQDLAQHVDAGECDNAVAGQGRFAGASSHCSVSRACGYVEPLPCFTNGYCAEAVCCGTTCGFGACTDGVFEGATPMIPGGGRGCGRTGNNANGVLCCRD